MGANASRERDQAENVKNTKITDNFEIQIFPYEDYNPGLLPESENVTLTLSRSQLICNFDHKPIKLDIPSSVTLWKVQRISLAMILCININKELFIWRLVAPTLKTFLLWKEAILISKRPEWLYSTVCQVCSKKFNLIRRQHHCRTCGKAVCGDCSRMETVLYMYGYRKPKIICTFCATRLPLRTQSLLQTIRSSNIAKALDCNSSQFSLKIYGNTSF
jgi:hypothetical protein